ncbi:hypothetical protein BDF22DRAFT_673921 [Syncephalis plumigaleata]|nr:hypothetical protein BDF22DRAFT_673921 [Syncephalis plumigaleata]
MSSNLVPFQPLLNPNSFTLLATITLILGALLSSAFSISSAKSGIANQLTLAASASTFLGFGMVFAFLAVGIYV